MLNDSKIQALFDELKINEAGTGNIGINETLKGYFYGISKADYGVGITTMYTDKKILFHVVGPDEPPITLVAYPHEIQNVEIKKGWIFFCFSFEFQEGHTLELKACKKTFGFKQQSKYLSELTENIRHYYIAK